VERFDRMRASAETSVLSSFDAGDDEEAPIEFGAPSKEEGRRKEEEERRRKEDRAKDPGKAAPSAPATPPSSAGTRPPSSHGRRMSPPAETQTITHAEPKPQEEAAAPAESVTLRLAEQMGAAMGTEATMALLAELSEHVASAEYREEAAASAVHKTVAGRLARLVELHNEDPRLLLRVARIMMQVVSARGSTLLSTCKMLFKLSKDEAHDTFFIEERVVEPLLSLIIREADVAAAAVAGGEAEPAAKSKGKSKRVVSELDLLVYAVGALKNISNNAGNQKVLSQQGVFAALSGVVEYTVAAAAGATPAGTSAAAADSGPQLGDRHVQVLVQATAALRNMAVQDAHRKQFLTFGLLESLSKLTAMAYQHAELIMNISRILSKLTLHEDCRARMYTREAIQGLLRAFDAHPANLALGLRLSFILGNLTTSNEEARLMLLECGAADTLLLHLARLVGVLDPAERPGSGSRPGSAGRPGSGGECVLVLVL
jgi:hypothetical protein